MIRELSIVAILSSMCLLALAKHHNEHEISFVTMANQDEVLFDQNEIVEQFSSRKKYNGILHYSLGARKASDRLVASGGQNQSWPQPHNVQIGLTYPPTGTGATVTYVAIVVNQTSNLGQAYVTKGGINQRNIQVVVEAYNTLVFNVQCFIYGY